ncbi:MAG: M23 family metallopeptidase [Microlunatus sp.]|nr:M23 family metallopeptidase [Microlunatus sp.]
MPPVGAPVELTFPFSGRWVAQNSPADRVPSHGIDLYGQRYAIDFLAVDDHDRSAPRTWRSIVAPEPPDLFVGFGRPILAPVAGTVVGCHDGEVDHEARRSPITLLPYAFGQAARARAGIPAIAGNHVVIAARTDGPYVLLAHLRRGSLTVAPGQVVTPGSPIGQCGNSGNSTEPHVHVQATDSVDWSRANGLPITFADRPGAAGWLPRNHKPFDVARPPRAG